MKRAAIDLGRMVLSGLVAWIATGFCMGLVAGDAAPADTVKFAASSSSDWQLDSLANYLHLQRLCENNLRHAEQELAALAKPVGKKDAGDFPLQKLLQGTGARIDLTQPYQVHVDAEVIEPAERAAAGPAGGAATGSDAAREDSAAAQYIRARKFHLRQKVPSSDKDGAPATFLTLNATLADFGIVATAANEPTGAQRTMGQGGRTAHAASDLLSWPFVVDLQQQVEVRYNRGPNGGPAAPIPPTGVMGDLAGLQFTADHIHALLAGDSRAGRCLFWAPPVEEVASGAATSSNETAVTHDANSARAHLEAAFDGGVVLTVEARSLEVELAWNAATGGTEIRWAGAGQVHLVLTGLRHDSKPGSAQQSTERWEMRADGFSLISLPGTVPVTDQDPAAADSTAWPAALPTCFTPTFVMSVQGHGRMVQRILRAGSAAPPADLADLAGGDGAENKPDATVLLSAWFDQGLFELERRSAAADPGVVPKAPEAAPLNEAAPLSGPVDPVGGAGGAAGNPSEPTLQRAWLRQGSLVRPARAAWWPLEHQETFYQARAWDRNLDSLPGRRVGGLLPAEPALAGTTDSIPQVVLRGVLLGAPATALGGAAGSGAATPWGTVLAEHLYYEHQGADFHAVAFAGEPLPGAEKSPGRVVSWQDGVHLLESPSIDLTRGTLTCTGANRYMEQGAAP